MRSELAEWPTHGYKKRGTGDPNRREHRSKLQTAPFVAWDGEGYSDDTGEHHYSLFGSSDGVSVSGRSLTYRDCFPLLLDSQSGINVIYGGDYDVIMMTRGMPWVVRNRLYKGLPVRYDKYRMVWFRKKYLLLKSIETGKSTILYDVLSFFQCSFVNACREYLGDSAELDAIHAMKLKRDSFTESDSAVVDYWKQELVFLVRLCGELRRLLAEVDIKPRGWYGPGAVASALMNLHDMKRYYCNFPQEIVDVGERCYYGGRFEQFKVGRMDAIHEYDIRSAYPKAITLLPDFSGIEWRYRYFKEGSYPETINPYAMYCVSWDVEYRPWQLGPLPWRDDRGRIFYPLKGYRSWYWGIEILHSLTRSFPREMYQIHEEYAPMALKFRHPFQWVSTMYDDRARMKREGNPAQRALKLGLNSLYGKLAQSTGAKKRKDGTWRKPTWHHVLWAGWVTAYTRAMLFNALRKSRTQIVAIETDALFTLKPIDEHLMIGEGLGEWERTDFDQILYVSSGVYYALSDGVWRLKTRGVEVDKSRSADHWLDIFRKLPHHPLEVTLKLRRFGTDIRQPDNFARWYDFTTTTKLPNAFSKRIHKCEVCVTCICDPSKTYADWLHHLIVPQPLISSDWQESTPYKFPWREDVKYDWNVIVKGDAIELPEELAWQ